MPRPDNGRMFRKNQSAVVLAGLLTIAGCSPPLDWRELRPEGKGLVAMFPCKPDRHARPVMVAGQRVRMEMLVCGADGATFALSFADLPDPAAVSPALSELRAIAAANVAGTVSESVELQVPGMTPNAQARRVAIVGRLPDGAAVVEQVAVFAKGLRVYQASVIGVTRSADAARIFLASLKLAV
jgi:hypothetical protein